MSETQKWVTIINCIVGGPLSPEKLEALTMACYQYDIAKLVEAEKSKEVENDA